MAFRFGKLQLGVMLGAAVAVSIWPGAGRAYTPEQQQACTGDAFRLCSAEIPDVDRVTICMVRNKAQLTPGCRAFFQPDPEPVVTPVRLGRPLSIRPATAKKLVSAKPQRPKQPAKPVAN